LELLAQVQESAAGALAGRGLVQLHDLGDLFEAEIADEAQDEDVALAGFQDGEVAAQPLGTPTLDELDLRVRWALVVVGHQLEMTPGAPLEAARAQPARDAKEPGTQAAVAAEGGQAPIGRQEGLLGELLGLFLLPEQGVTEPADGRAVIGGAPGNDLAVVAVLKLFFEGELTLGDRLGGSQHATSTFR
jgi:hypothetical protein